MHMWLRLNKFQCACKLEREREREREAQIGASVFQDVLKNKETKLSFLTNQAGLDRSVACH